MGGWYTVANTYMNKGVEANYDNDVVQAVMAEQDNGCLVLDNVDFG